MKKNIKNITNDATKANNIAHGVVKSVFANIAYNVKQPTKTNFLNIKY